MTTKSKRHKVNPFLENMIIPIGEKSVQISSLGKDSNILVNQVTGEVAGTHVIARKRVDTKKFVKTFADYMAFTFDLTRAGNKTLRVVMWAMQEQAINKDVVLLDKHTHQGFLEYYGMTPGAPPQKRKSNGIPELSYTTFTRGLSELEKAQIIAKTVRLGHYWINPQCMFNGDRIAFTTLIERRLKSENDNRELDPTE